MSFCGVSGYGTELDAEHQQRAQHALNHLLTILSPHGGTGLQQVERIVHLAELPVGEMDVRMTIVVSDAGIEVVGVALLEIPDKLLRHDDGPRPVVG